MLYRIITVLIIGLACSSQATVNGVSAHDAIPDSLIKMKELIGTDEVIIIDEFGRGFYDRWFTLMVRRDNKIIYERSLDEFSTSGSHPISIEVVNYSPNEPMIALKYSEGSGGGTISQTIHSFFLFKPHGDTYRLVLYTPFWKERTDGEVLEQVEYMYEFEYVRNEGGTIEEIRKKPAHYIVRKYEKVAPYEYAVHDSIEYQEREIVQQQILPIERYRWDSGSNKFLPVGETQADQ